MAIAMDVAEATFYEDDAMKRLKSKMTLDFNSSKSKRGLMSQVSSVLNSPDLQLLKLASPELERMIIQHNGMVTTTPTPTQFGGAPHPKIDVTEEQEAYAKGFVDALAELHQKQTGQMPTSASLSSIVNLAHQTLANHQAATALSQSAANFSTTTSLPGTVIPQQVAAVSSSNMAIPSRLVSQPTRMVSPLARTSSPVVVAPTHPKVLQVKEESDTQMVPSLGITPPVSPICMESQERIKLDRKRARNRVAARKCRTRKLERIARLEERVAELKGQNSDLQLSAGDLRTEVARLKQQIMEHVNSGCQVMLSQNLL